MNEVLEEQLANYRHMVVLDMDNTILRGRFVDSMAETYGFKEQLSELRKKENDPVILCKRIGRLMKGRTMEEMLQVISRIPLVDDIKEVSCRVEKKKLYRGDH